MTTAPGCQRANQTSALNLQVSDVMFSLVAGESTAASDKVTEQEQAAAAARGDVTSLK